MGSGRHHNQQQRNSMPPINDTPGKSFQAHGLS
jgi:hypothetical protein